MTDMFWTFLNGGGSSGEVTTTVKWLAILLNVFSLFLLAKGGRVASSDNRGNGWLLFTVSQFMQASAFYEYIPRVWFHCVCMFVGAVSFCLWVNAVSVEQVRPKSRLLRFILCTPDGAPYDEREQLREIVLKNLDDYLDEAPSDVSDTK